jgi:putative membrane protein
MIELLPWLRVGHFIGLFVWLGGMFALYWMMRFHAHAPESAHDKLVLSERSLALMMDLGSALAIGCGLALALVPTPSAFAQGGWLHAKLTVVVLGLLSVHGMLRARVKRLSQGTRTAVPGWQWSLLLGSIAAIVLLAVKGPVWLAKSPGPAPTAPAPTAPAPPAP